MVGGFPLDKVLNREAVWFWVWKSVVPLGGLGILLVSDGIFLLGDSILGWKGFV